MKTCLTRRPDGVPTDLLSSIHIGSIIWIHTDDWLVPDFRNAVCKVIGFVLREDLLCPRVKVLACANNKRRIGKCYVLTIFDRTLVGLAEDSDFLTSKYVLTHIKDDEEDVAFYENKEVK